MERLLLIDGHNLLFRMFYGMPDEYRSPKGHRYNAVLGFGRTVTRAVALLHPSRLLAVFDSSDCGSRRELDEAYKANRPDWSEVPEEERPFTQLPAVFGLLERMGVPYAEIHGCEADDVIAAYARRVPEDGHAVILSTDRDYWQLIGERVSVLDWRGMESTLITPPIVERKLGVRPDQVADFKCLVGDSSDHIPGVPGVGPKTAAALLARFGTLEKIVDRADEIERPAVRRAVMESHERLKLNDTLIRLNGEAETPYGWKELSFELKEPRSMIRAVSELADLLL